ncbi:uncharacterized protein BDW70DRAFT_154482 [Aspergillus foveolatus]|uniref:uncharacterized protein n=1 Tax=Aspergillus foveolatus TaxID=210207 RepID=UPI003CCE03A5
MEMHIINHHTTTVADYPHDLIAYPQPTIKTPADPNCQSADWPFQVPLSLECSHQWMNIMTSFTPMVMETTQGCDHYVHGIGMLVELLDNFQIAYQEYLESNGGALTKHGDHGVDADAFALLHADIYPVYPIPMSNARMIWFMAPWVPRAHHGGQERLVIETTLVVPRDALPTNPEYSLYTPQEIKIDGGAFLANIQDARKNHTTSCLGPWGNSHPLCKIPVWPAWKVILMKNMLFNTDPDRAHLRWTFIDQAHRAITEAAKLAVESFIQAEAALFPNNSYQSEVPALAPDKDTFDLPEVGNIYHQDPDDS